MQPTHASDGQSVAIEAWRGVAAWLVVYAHFWAFSGTDWPPLRLAHTGVNLFFVVSGFVFAPYLFGQTLHLRAHLVRRFFRIYPAYVLALGLYVAMKAQAGQPLLYIAEHLAFAHVQTKEMAFYYNPPFWSLPAEVEFYLALPLLAGLAGLGRAAAGRWGAALLALLAAAAVLRGALGSASDGQAQNAAFVALFHLPGVLVEFLLGAAAWRVSRRSLSAIARAGMGAAGLAGWAALALWFARVGDAGVEASVLRGQVGALAALCFALLVAATVGAPVGKAGPADGRTDGRTSGARAGTTTGAPAATAGGLRALAVWAGRLSYGVYLFHGAALQAAVALAAAWGWSAGGARGLALALTLAMATAVYLAWENPWRRLGRRWAARLQG
ncbi:MAG: acyltransferase family protein [Rubrivivax sp.]